MSTHPDKELANRKARAALMGATLYRVEDDRDCELFIVSKSHMTRHLSSLEAVDAWLDQLEGKTGARG